MAETKEKPKSSFIKKVNPKTSKSNGPGYIGDFRMSYEQLKSRLNDVEANDSDWIVQLFDDTLIEIYPSDWQNINELHLLKKNSEWSIGLYNLAGFGNRWGKVYNTIMHFILQDKPKIDEHDVIRSVLTAKDT